MKSQIICIFESDKKSPMEIHDSIEKSLDKDVKNISFLAIQFNGMETSRKEKIEWFVKNKT